MQYGQDEQRYPFGLATYEFDFWNLFAKSLHMHLETEKSRSVVFSCRNFHESVRRDCKNSRRQLLAAGLQHNPSNMAENGSAQALQVFSAGLKLLAWIGIAGRQMPCGTERETQENQAVSKYES